MTTNGVKNVTLLDVDVPAAAPLTMPTVSAEVSIFERLAKDEAMDVDKLERLMQMHERAKAQFAKEQFNAAMSSAQKAMRPIAADMDNNQTKSRYASYAALDRVLRPIYTEHGFALSFDTGEGAPALYVRVLCYVSHIGGHERTYHADIPADGKGAKGGDVMTLTHAFGAGTAYGMRYLLKMIFNVAVGEDDRDGNAPPAKEPPKAPDGFESWLMDLQAVADNGYPALKKAWDASRDAYRTHLKQVDAPEIERLKAKARKVAA